MNERREAELRKLDRMSIEEVRAFAKGLFGKDDEPESETKFRCLYNPWAGMVMLRIGVSRYDDIRWSDAFRAALEAQEVKK